MEEKIEIWRRTDRKQIADCRVFKVREDFCETEDGAKKSSFFVIENPDWVNIIALTNEEQVVLIEQFRHGIEQTILELPGGIIDENEEPLVAAKRELMEETGFSADQWILLGKSHPNPAIQDNALYHFLALDARKTGAPEFDEHESVLPKLIDLSEIDELMSNEIITHSLVLAAFQKFSLFNKKRISEINENFPA